MSSSRQPDPKSTCYLKLIMAIIILALIGSACAPASPKPTSTTASEPTQPEDPVNADDSYSPADTAPPDTIAPTPSPTVFPLPTRTATPAPYANVTGNTNCRFGPGSVYDLLHTYLAGAQVQLEGKSEDGFFWYTSDVEGTAPDCWLWGKYATPVGDTAQLPIYTPPPTPTPAADYELTYHRTDVQGGKWRFSFRVENTGSMVWESAMIYIYDPISGESAGFFQNWFWKYYVPGETVASNIPPGKDGYVEAGGISDPYADPDGGRIQAYIVVCELDDLEGLCLGEKITIDA
jgi:hypothetical protein